MNIKFLNWNKFIGLFSIVALFSLTSCLDDNDVEPVSVAYVSIYHFSPDAPDIDVELDDRLIFNQALEYTDFSSYLRFYPGNRELTFTPYNANNILVDTTYEFMAEKAYSVFVSGENANLSTLILEDKIETPATGKALVRFIQLAPDAAAVDLFLNEETSPLVADRAFMESSEFQSLDANKYDLNVKAVSGTETLVSVDQTEFKEGGVYSIIMRGFENAPSGNNNDLSIQIVRNQ